MARRALQWAVGIVFGTAVAFRSLGFAQGITVSEFVRVTISATGMMNPRTFVAGEKSWKSERICRRRESKINCSRLTSAVGDGRIFTNEAIGFSDASRLVAVRYRVAYQVATLAIQSTYGRFGACHAGRAGGASPLRAGGAHHSLMRLRCSVGMAFDPDPYFQY